MIEEIKEDTQKRMQKSLEALSGNFNKIRTGTNSNENFLHWYLKHGPKFIEMILEISDPLDARLKVVKA